MKKKIAKVKVSAKCSDLCWVLLEDTEGNTVAENDGYVPGFMPGEHYGDYVELEIDPNTGIILNWDKPTRKQMVNDVEGM